MDVTKFTGVFKNKAFLLLYLAEAISLLGDAITWVGIALLSYQFGGERSAAILSAALTLRVAAFIIFGPYAGVLADRLDRKKILIITHLVRMAIVACLPFINAEWQIYVLIFFLNVFNAFFNPAYKSAVPQVITDKESYAPAISLSNGTWQLLGVLGPGLAGILAAWFGARQIFMIDAATFIIAAIFILLIPRQALATKTVSEKPGKVNSTWQDILKGTRLLFQNRAVRFALGVELAAAIAGAHILVNTIGYIEGTLQLTSREYGWVMASFAIGAAIAAFGIGILDKSRNKVTALLTGILLLVCAISGANYVTLLPLLLMWLFAGLGQSLCEMPSQILIAENIPLEQQGKVYGAHFAWSHLWWAIAYPIAGFTGIQFKSHVFLVGAGLSFVVLLAIAYANLTYLRKRQFETV